MNWSEVRQLYLSGCGEQPAAAAEALLHLNQGNFEICSKLDLQELEDEDSVSVALGEDYATLPSGILHIIQVDNVTEGRRMDPEEAGMRGRSRFLDSNSGVPPQGNPTYYTPANGRLYIRPTADGDYDLRIRFKKIPDTITSADWGIELELPAQYQMAVAHAAARSYLTSHPGKVPEEKAASAQLIATLTQSIGEKLTEPMRPKERERFDQRGRLLLQGFRIKM